MVRAWLLLVLGGCDYVLRLDEVPAPPSRVVAHYRFEQPGPEIIDETGVHPGIVPGPGELVAVDGQDGGGAVAFPASPGAHVVVEPSDDWSLTEASIELWVKLPATNETMGIVSRDSVGDRDGNFTLFHLPDGLVARLQIDSTQPNSDAFLCSNAPVAVDRWIHVGINFGPPQAELWIDGARQDTTRTVALFGSSECGTVGPRALTGNYDPWIFGASGASSSPATADQPVNPFVGGAIDDMIIRSSRWPFDQR